MEPFKISDVKSALVFGAGHGIGLEFVRNLLEEHQCTFVFATFRNEAHHSDLVGLKEIYPERLFLHQLRADMESDYVSLAQLMDRMTTQVDLLINCIGFLHDSQRQPEKRLEDIDPEKFLYSISCNTIPTLLMAKHFKKFFKNSKLAVFAALSARVGSISDNRSGGWYGYRASKTALNMCIKNIAIEFERLRNNTIVLALHPGTTDTALSKPFTSRTKYKLHIPAETAQNLLAVIQGTGLNDSGAFIDWQGEPIEW